MTTESAQFVNESKALTEKRIFPAQGDYGFDRAPRLLFLWSRLFQSIVSQAGSRLLSGRFHDSHCAIFKCEGGCRIDGKGDLVLSDSSCYWDYGRSGVDDVGLKTLAALITHIVLEWNPLDPKESMFAAAANFMSKELGVPSVEMLRQLHSAVKKSSNGGVFGGNALSDFFRWNPFSNAPIDRDYQRFCLVKFENWKDADVDQKYADEDLGESLLKRVNEAIDKNNSPYGPRAMCCSPRRDGNKLGFWVNTGRSTQIDGWKTQVELEAFIASGAKIVDKAKY